MSHEDPKTADCSAPSPVKQSKTDEDVTTSAESGQACRRLISEESGDSGYDSVVSSSSGAGSAGEPPTDKPDEEAKAVQQKSTKRGRRKRVSTGMAVQSRKSTAQKTTKESKAKTKTKKAANVESHKLTEYYAVRKSGRVTQAALKESKQTSLKHSLASGSQNGLEIREFDGKGRGIVATRRFERNDFVVEYRGQLLEVSEAKQRESEYSTDSDVGCYMYYFKHESKTWCVDATAESPYYGRLVNHSAKRPNCMTRAVSFPDANAGRPYLLLVAKRTIKEGEELLYDYGDRSREAVEANPWLTNT